MAQNPENIPMSGGDPTQRLLTLLGRFHRYVAKGQAGAPQEFWCDDCMNQLIAAVELAIENKWTFIVESLTGTARILHSYEQPNYAHLGIPFLNDSYEILCLMVGDLLVNVRSGAMEKWRELYERAVADLGRAGLPLVQDDDGAEPSAAAQPVAVEKPVAKPEILPFRPAEVDQESPETPELVLYEPPEPEPEPVAEVVEEVAPVGEAPVGEAPIAVAAPKHEEEEGLLPLFDIIPEVAAAEAPAPEPEAVPQMEATPAPEPEPETPKEFASEVRVVRLLDALCDDLSRLEKVPERQLGDYLSLMADKVQALEDYADEAGLKVPVRLCGQMVEICTTAARVSAIPNDRFFDCAYAFCETYVDATRRPKSSLVKSWTADGAALLESLKAIVKVQEPETPPVQIIEEKTETPVVAPPRDSSVDVLLESARQAAASGDVSGAKMIALQAVARLAEEEASKADSRVRDAETRFRQNAESIENSRVDVKKAEQEVAAAEGRMAEVGAELTDARAHTTVVGEKVQDLEKRVAEIDQQLKALMAARDSELARVAETREELDRARDEEESIEAKLAALREAEQAARAKHEESRQHVKELQRNRLELEEMLSRARETLTHHRSSLSDIEKTIVQWQPKQAADSEAPESLLF